MTTTILSLLSADLLRDYYAKGWWCDETIYAVAAGHAAVRPEAPAIRDRFRRLSWVQVVERADLLAAELKAHGLKRGSG